MRRLHRKTTILVRPLGRLAGRRPISPTLAWARSSTARRGLCIALIAVGPSPGLRHPASAVTERELIEREHPVVAAWGHKRCAHLGPHRGGDFEQLACGLAGRRSGK